MARPCAKNPTGAQKSSKRTPKVLTKLEEAFAFDCSVGEACFYADISESTYYDWVKDEPELSERFKALRNKPILKARQTVVQGLNDPKNAQWYLERKLKSEFGTKTDINHTSSDNSMTPSVIDASKLSDDALKELMNIRNESDK
jgi:hypothetical protein